MSVADKNQPNALPNADDFLPENQTPILLYLLFAALLIPVNFYLGPVRLTPYRALLLVTFIPCALSFLNGKAGRIRIFDILFILHATWAALALIKTHGFGKGLEPAGIYVVECLGPYFIARTLIRSADQLYNIIKFWVIAITILIPFGAFESYTGRNILVDDILSTFFYTLPSFDMEERWGLERATVLFPHAILYGVFCASAFSMAFYVKSDSEKLFKRIFATIPVIIATFFSLSAGPFLAMLSQMALIGWDNITRFMPSRWLLLIAALLTVYVIIDILSNRTTIEVIISYMTFSYGNAYYRTLIWHYGTAEVLRNPIFGIGLSPNWIRPHWMGDSMDNFWLVSAVRYGLPGFILLVAAKIGMILSLAQAPDLPRRLSDYRKAWIITMIGFILVGSTVHFWDQVFCLYCFLLGCCAWILDNPEDPDEEDFEDNSAEHDEETARKEVEEEKRRKLRRAKSWRNEPEVTDS